MTRRRNLFGYCDRLTVRPGDTVSFKVSSYDAAAYDATLVRIVNGDAVSGADHYSEIEVQAPFNGRYEGRYQASPIGSYVLIPEAGPLDGLGSFTVQCFVFATTPGKGMQHLVSRWSNAQQRGWALAIDENGCPAFVAGDGSGDVVKQALSRPLSARRWSLLAAAVDVDGGTITLAQYPLPPTGHETAPEAETVSTGLDAAACVQAGPLLLGASLAGTEDGGVRQTIHAFNGRLESVRIADCPFSRAQIEEAARPDVDSTIARHLVACWDFSRDIGTTHVRDLSGNGMHGRTVNLPLRAVRGVLWDATSFDWKQRPEHYGAIHFHDDDLYDCEWETDFVYTVPDDLRSGIYAARLRNDRGAEEYITFFVAGHRMRATAKVAVMLPTFTYLAYANEQFDVEKLPPGGKDNNKQLVVDPDYYDEMRAYPEFARSCYDFHSDGTPVHVSSWLRPILNLEPKSNLFALCPDTLITAWLEHDDIDYDIITDDLVDDEGPDALLPYKVVLSGNHPEYASLRLLEALRSYLGQGGRFMYLGGNGFYWRVATHDELPGAIEIRRGRSGSGTWFSEVGEDYHAFSGERGGIWLDNGRPPQQLVGVGFIAQGFGGSSYYRRRPDADDPRAAFIFEDVDGDIIGDFGLLGGGTAGEEIDAANFDLGTPRHALVVARSECHNEAMLQVREEMSSTRPYGWMVPRMHADLCFFETPSGGAVFSTGSMAWVGGLCHDGYDNNVAQISRNVLARFMDDAPFEYPGAPFEGPRDGYGYTARTGVFIAP